MSELITLTNITKKFDDHGVTKVIEHITFTIYTGDFITVFGPNGAGKTTLLHMIAGLEDPSSGSITRSPHLRIGYVFQNYDESLLPWRTVKDNIRLPFETMSVSPEEIESKVDKVVALLKLEPFLEKYPYMLSGGKKQLVALGRALVTDPDLLIMDEPFSSLDFDTTNEMEQLVMRIWEELGITILFVSHNIDEAILLATKVIILSAQPSSIKEVIPVALPRPRNQQTTTTDLFAEIKKRVLKDYETHS